MSATVRRVLLRAVAQYEAVAAADGERARELDAEALDLRQKVAADLEAAQELRAALMALGEQ